MPLIDQLVSGRLSFSLVEILSLLGVAQCLYILVYLLFRSGRISRGTIPILFFTFLGTAFSLDLAETSWAPLVDSYKHLQWFFWFSCAPLSVLLVLQVAQITRTPHWEYFLLMLFIPLGYLAAFLFVGDTEECNVIFKCQQMDDALLVLGVIIGAISLLTIWFKKDILETLLTQKKGRERFWLSMSIIVLNVSFITIFVLVSYEVIALQDANFIRTLLGFAFVYLAATSLFRIYPQAVSIRPKGTDVNNFLTDNELECALKIETLLDIDKVYQEPAYGRSDLARELGVTESSLSKIVNNHFQKSVPQLLNAYRVEDAKHLLVETDADLATISEEAGFNSVTTFNRYFKGLVGTTPSEYRAQKSQ
ncbi:MAG: AraC family transcriptional regulator [Alphaproteobacteria bacterium]|nr:AraC family transcriptional regulator [Alphaproteobacteria bacterium]